MITFDFKTYLPDIKEDIDFDALLNKLKNDKLNDWFLYDEKTEQIELLAERIKSNYDIFLVVGIGGSILGSLGFIKALSPYLTKKKPEVLYVGNNLSSEYLNEILEYIKDKKTFVNFISKSGSTLEPNIAFDEIAKVVNKKDIIITTEEESNLYNQAIKEGIKVLPFPKNVGGRFSLLKLPGLLPMAVAGLDIKQIIEGSIAAKENTKDIEEYIKIRNYFNKQLTVEMFNLYEPKLQNFLECIEQIFSETQGKENKGLLPVIVSNTGKLHSLGQYVQEGKNISFETTIIVEKTNDILINKYNKSLNNINILAATSVAKSHFENNRYTNIIKIDELNEFNLGYLAMFFMISSALGSYLLDINYYDQPGVSKYKEILSQNL